MTLRLAWAAAALWLTGCSARVEPVPDLPQVTVDQFSPGIREQVQKVYDEARARSDDAETCGKLGMVLHAYDQFQAAEACYRRAGRLDPTKAAWAYYLGVVQSAAGKNAEAADSLQEALRLEREYLPAQVRLAEVLLALGRIDESRRLYEEIAAKHPDFPGAHYGLGRTQAALGEPEAALGHYRKAVELAPDYGAAHYALALAYQKQGDAQQARRHMALYQKNPLGGAAPQDPLMEAVKALNESAQNHLKRGVSLEAEGRIAESIAEHEKALDLNPKLIQAHMNLITLYGKSGQADRVEKHYRATVELNPNLAEAHYNYGVFLFERQKYPQAAEAFRKALEVNPRYAEAHNNLAFILERQGRLDEAMRHLEAAVENRPNYRLAHFHLGRLLLAKRRYQEAIRHFHQTLTPEDADTPGYLYGLASAYGRWGDRKNALRYMREARARAEKLGQTRLLAGIDRDLRLLEGR